MLRYLVLLAATAVCSFANDPQCTGYNHPTYGKVGQCIDVSQCPGSTYISGLCPSYGNSIKCCFTVGSTSTGCTVRAYTHANLVGSTANVEDGFRYAMDHIVSAASSCGVKVYITSSFRLADQPVNGAVVAPATSSNHHVGKAVDFNLADMNGNVICNSVCLQAKQGSAACFINAIQAKGLTWGGTFSTADPVHIDDRANLKAGYDSLKIRLQTNFNGKWSNWSAWGACSVTCGNGVQTRSNVCTPPKNGGAPCPGASTETRLCKKAACKPNPCAGVFCGEHGTCSAGACRCTGGYSGAQCQIPPPDKCAVLVGQPRKECHYGFTSDLCEARGCIWCPLTIRDPSCYYKCTVPAGQRTDCHPEWGATSGACAARGCNWCPLTTAGPWCFYPSLR